MSAVPATFTDVTTARLPVAYEAAQKAIAECERIDECKSWSDKAAALASYARQANDDSLRVMAVRIQARAERRCGELLKQIPRGDEATRFGKDGSVPPVTRTQAATEAGLSERQRKTALRIASIPADDFHRQIESQTPPTMTRLAEQGKVHRAEAPASGGESVAIYQSFVAFVRFCKANDAVDLAKGMPASMGHDFRQFVAIADGWLDQFVTNLPE